MDKKNEPQSVAPKSFVEAELKPPYRTPGPVTSIDTPMKSEPPAKRTSDRCLQNAKPGEPIFVLRAQDMFAPLAVSYWIDLVTSNPKVPADKVLEAKQIVAAMLDWQHANGCKVPD